MKPLSPHEMRWQLPPEAPRLGQLRVPAALTVLDLLWEDLMEVELELDRARQQLQAARELLSVALTQLYHLTGQKGAAHVRTQPQ